MNTPLISISEGDLSIAFAEWEQDYRDGKCLSVEESLNKPVEEVAAINAKNMFARLQSITSAHQEQA